MVVRDFVNILKWIRNFNMQFVLYPVTVNGGNQWRWRLVADNGRILASGESFHNRQDCVDSVNLVMDTNRQTKFVEMDS